MFEKNLQLGFLLDFYGELLSDRKRSAMEMYYNEDLSLAEIAEEFGISRQGVRDMLKKSEEELFFYEEKLGLAARLRQVEANADALCRIVQRHPLPDELKESILSLAQAVKNGESK